MCSHCEMNDVTYWDYMEEASINVCARARLLITTSRQKAYKRPWKRYFPFIRTTLSGHSASVPLMHFFRSRSVQTWRLTVSGLAAQGPESTGGVNSVFTGEKNDWWSPGDVLFRLQGSAAAPMRWNARGPESERNPIQPLFGPGWKFPRSPPPTGYLLSAALFTYTDLQALSGLIYEHMCVCVCC